jgi:hypothetical protein
MVGIVVYRLKFNINYVDGMLVKKYDSMMIVLVLVVVVKITP